MKKTTLIRRTLAAVLLASVSLFGGVAVTSGSFANHNVLMADTSLPSDTDVG
ncbi:MAG TPA: hypothetical protein VF171_03585 [Trueperaceae bacterium]